MLSWIIWTTTKIKKSFRKYSCTPPRVSNNEYLFLKKNWVAVGKCLPPFLRAGRRWIFPPERTSPNVPIPRCSDRDASREAHLGGWRIFLKPTEIPSSKFRKWEFHNFDTRGVATSTLKDFTKIWRKPCVSRAGLNPETQCETAVPRFFPQLPISDGKEQIKLIRWTKSSFALKIRRWFCPTSRHDGWKSPPQLGWFVKTNLPGSSDNIIKLWHTSSNKNNRFFQNWILYLTMLN